MSLKDWKTFISLIPNEKVILVDTESRFYPGASILESYDGCLVFTNKRLIGLSKKYKGIFSKKYVGFGKVLFEFYLDDIDFITVSDKRNTALKIRKKIRLYSDKEYDLGIELETRSRLINFQKDLSSAILLSKEPKTVKQEVVQYNISTKFEFGKEGGLLINCPLCNGASPLTSKTNPVRCPYCNQEYIVPKKLLELI